MRYRRLLEAIVLKVVKENQFGRIDLMCELEFDRICS